MNKRNIASNLLSLLFVMVSADATAKDMTRAVTVNADKGNLSAIYYLIDGESVGEPYNVNSDAPPNAVNGMVCGSVSNSTNGRCATELIYEFGNSGMLDLTYGALITLRATSAQKETRDIALLGYYRNDCRANLLTKMMISCSSQTPMRVWLAISDSTLNGLTPGVWKATLVLYHRKGYQSPNNGTWRVNITLNISDTGNQQIFFPAFANTTPVMDLNLRFGHPSGSQAATHISGSTSLDMCLYDGRNARSNRVTLLVQDDGGMPPRRQPGLFSVYRTGLDKSNPANRIDYQVSVINPISHRIESVANGKAFSWMGSDNPAIQHAVKIPGIPGTVLCLPAQLMFITPAFPAEERTVGHYTGRMRITYTPSTTS